MTERECPCGCVFTDKICLQRQESGKHQGGEFDLGVGLHALFHRLHNTAGRRGLGIGFLGSDDARLHAGQKEGEPGKVYQTLSLFRLGVRKSFSISCQSHVSAPSRRADKLKLTSCLATASDGVEQARRGVTGGLTGERWRFLGERYTE